MTTTTKDIKTTMEHPATLATMKQERQTVPTYAEYVQNVGNAAAYIAIRARTRLTGLAYLQDLQAHAKADSRRASVHMYAETAATAMAEHDKHQAAAEAAAEEAHNARRMARNVTTDPADLEALQEYADRMEREAMKHREAAAMALAHAQDVDKVIATTSTSDRADIVQAAVVAFLDAMAGEDMGDHEARDAAFYVAIKAAGNALHAMAAAKGHPHTKTAKTHISAEQARAWFDTYGEGGKEPYTIRGGMESGYKTVEHRTPKDGSPAGYYMVYHYKSYTPKPLDEACDKPAPAVDDSDLQALFDRAKLSARERDALQLLTEDSTDPRAEAVRAAGIAAVEAHEAETARRIAAAETQERRQRIRRERAKQVDKTRAAAMLSAALTAAGVPETAQRMTASRIRAKLSAAMERKPIDPAPIAKAAEAQPLRVTVYTSKDNRPEALREYGREYAHMSIKWGKHYPKPEAIPAAPAEQHQPKPCGLDPEARAKYARKLDEATAAAQRMRDLQTIAEAEGRRTQAAWHAEAAEHHEARAAIIRDMLAI